MKLIANWVTSEGSEITESRRQIVLEYWWTLLYSECFVNESKGDGCCCSVTWSFERWVLSDPWRATSWRHVSVSRLYKATTSIIAATISGSNGVDGDDVDEKLFELCCCLFRLYNKITDTCFRQCVNSFHSKKLEGSENRCLNTCVLKFMKMSQRIGQRYQEHQIQQSQQGMQFGQMAPST